MRGINSVILQVKAQRSSVEVTEIIVEAGRAVGVITKSGARILAKNIIANVNPALLPKLLKEREEAKELNNFRSGLATMMIHLAMSELPKWLDKDAGAVITGKSWDEVSEEYADRIMDNRESYAEMVQTSHPN